MDNACAGLNHDKHGLTQLGRVVLDAWLFGLIAPTQDCAGWELGRMQALMEQVQAKWDAYGHLPSHLPPDLRERHAALYDQAIASARAKGWDPALGEDE